MECCGAVRSSDGVQLYYKVSSLFSSRVERDCCALISKIIKYTWQKAECRKQTAQWP